MSTQFPPQNLLLRVASRAVVLDLVQQIVFLAVCVDFYRAGLLPSMLSSEMVQAHVGGNPVDPGRKCALKTEAGELLQGPEKCFLINILSISLRPGNPQCEP